MHGVLRGVGAAGAVAVLALFSLGILMLATIVQAWIPAAGVVVAAVLPAVVYRITRRTAAHVVFIAPLIVLIPVVGLLAFDVLWAWAGLARPAPWAGLVIAGVVVAGLEYAYLRWLSAPPPPRLNGWALFAFCAGLALSALTRDRFPEPKLFAAAACVCAATWIYLWFVAGPHISHPFWWTLLIVVVAVICLPLIGEAVQGHRLSTGLLIAGAIAFAIAGLSLRALPENPPDHVRRIVGAVLLAGVAVPVLVFVIARVALPPPHKVQPVALPSAEAAGPLPQAALAHRPILLFDSGEHLRTPLNVDSMFGSRVVNLCPEDTGLLAGCDGLSSAQDLRNGVGNLNFETQQLEDADIQTTIYVHPVGDPNDASLLDLDYWWYLPDNPANTARGAMCGAGLVIPEITCFDHQSDWEGVTVVVRKDSGEPVSVHYAAHNHVVNVPWPMLQNIAARLPADRYPARSEAAQHPLIFIARGTHAAYPVPCTQDFCDSGTAFEDNQHDGMHEWPCGGSSCVTAFPTRAGGTLPASWNAFDGHWGSAICLAHIYCARSDAPRAPGSQPRYKRPWCYDYEVVANPRRPRAVAHRPPGCVTR